MKHYAIVRDVSWNRERRCSTSCLQASAYQHAIYSLVIHNYKYPHTYTSYTLSYIAYSTPKWQYFLRFLIVPTYFRTYGNLLYAIAKNLHIILIYLYLSTLGLGSMFYNYYFILIVNIVFNIFTHPIFRDACKLE